MTKQKENLSFNFIPSRCIIEFDFKGNVLYEDEVPPTKLYRISTT
jgi:hypothetical protein